MAAPEAIPAATLSKRPQDGLTANAKHNKQVWPWRDQNQCIR
jgi:hypothetical protein